MSAVLEGLLVVEKSYESVVSCVLGCYANHMLAMHDKSETGVCDPPLFQVFGMEAKEIYRGKVKCYILVNTLPSSKRDDLVEW